MIKKICGNEGEVWGKRDKFGGEGVGMELILAFEWVCEEIWTMIARLNDKKIINKKKNN